MPLLGKLITYCMASLFGFLVKWIGTQWAVRITAAITLGGIYLSCVIFFTTMIGPWLASFFTYAWLGFIGLLFPPVAGAVTAGMGLYYTCIAAKRYTARLMKMAVG